MIRELILTRLGPSQLSCMTISIGIIRTLAMPIVSEPALIAEFARTPAHQGGFTDPGIVIVLAAVSVRIIFGIVQRFRVALGEHDQVPIGKGANAAFRGES